MTKERYEAIWQHPLVQSFCKVPSKYKYFRRDYSHKVFFFTTYYDKRSEMTENRFDSNILSDFHVVSYECLKHILLNTPVSFQLGDFNRFLSAFNLMKYIRTGFGRDPEKVLEKYSKRQDAVKKKHEVLSLIGNE